MANIVILPRQGQSVESCIITSWEVKEGDYVKEGDLLFTYETDKTAFEEVSKFSGTLLKCLVEEGDDVPVLDEVAIIGEAGEDISSLIPKKEKKEEPKLEPKVEAKMKEVKVPEKVLEQKPAQEVKRVFASKKDINISPRAKNTAESMGLDYTYATPSGPNNRVIERDIMALSKAGRESLAQGEQLSESVLAELGTFTDVKLSTVRKAIASSMHHSISSMAQLTHSFSFDATQIIAYRKHLKSNAKSMGLTNITYNDMILYAVSRVLLRHPEMNSHFLDDKMRIFDQVNLGMAVDTPRGLLVPTLFAADKMSLNDIALQTKKLAKMAGEGTISPDLVTNGTFTVSNLGVYGVEHFTPVINPPQVGIIGVNNIQVKFRMEEGKAVPYQAMGLSLTYDHRAVDGAPASRFMKELCDFLENFTLMLAR